MIQKNGLNSKGIMTESSFSQQKLKSIDDNIDEDQISYPNDSLEMEPIDVKQTSLKIGWSGCSAHGIKVDCYLLQWRLHTSKEWVSLPATVSVPRVRLDNLDADTMYDFRVRGQVSSNAVVRTHFSKPFTFKTLGSTFQNDDFLRVCDNRFQQEIGSR